MTTIDYLKTILNLSSLKVNLNRLLPKLNFPEYTFRFKKNEKSDLLIFDEIRKKFVQLTPEEWVRQHLICFLIYEKKYPKGLFSIEKGLKLNNTNKRTDVRVYDTTTKLVLLAECKAPHISISAQTIEQALRYELSLKAEIVFVTNGLQHLCFRKDQDLKFIAINHLPDFTSAA